MTTVTTRIATPALSRRAAALLLAGSVLAALVIAVLALGGSGGSGPLRWSGDGEVVASTPVFLRAFGKSLWGGGRGSEQASDTELQRTGRIALLAPGEEVPLTVAWRTEDGDPVRVDYGRGSLSLPG